MATEPDDGRELARQAAQLAALTDVPAGVPATSPDDARGAPAPAPPAPAPPAPAPTVAATDAGGPGTAQPPEPGAEARRLASFTATLSRSARSAGVVAVANGHWLAETVVDLASHLPLRDLATLEAHHDGRSGPALAEALVRNASRSSAAVGAAAGAAMSVEEWLPPGWVVVPFELLAETAAIAAIEMKLIGELHEVFGQPVTGAPLEKGYALARAWAEQRRVTTAVLTEGAPALGDAIGRSARKEVIRRVRRRAMRRTGRNAIGLGPLMIGGALGATLNRRSTNKLGEAVIADLEAARRRSPG